MGFNSSKFISTQFIPREKGIEVKDLKPWFEKKSKPVWRVRGLTGYELAWCEEIKRRNKQIEKILEGLLQSGSQKQKEAIQQLVGSDPKNATDDVAKRIEMLCVGSVDPKCDNELAIKLLTNFPIEFFDITNHINLLTGKGHVPGKPKPSGKTHP